MKDGGCALALLQEPLAASASCVVGFIGTTSGAERVDACRLR